MSEDEEAGNQLAEAEKKLVEIKEQNGDPGEPEATENIQEAESIISVLRKDKQLTLKKLVQINQIISALSKKFLINHEEEAAVETYQSVKESRQEYVRLSHAQRVQLKEATAKMESRLKIQKNVWYWRWKRIYKDDNEERVEATNKLRDQVIRLMDFE